MITYYYRSLRTEATETLENYRRGAWVYVESPSSEEVERLVNKFQLERGFIEDALDEDEMPRLEKEDGISYIFVRYAYRAANGGLQTAPLLFVFGSDVMMTISLKRLPVVDSLLRGKISVATTQRAKLVLQILQQMSEQYDNYISATTRKIKGIRARLRSHGITNRDLIDFVTIEDELNEFLSSLQPANLTLRRLLRGNYIALFEEDQDIVEDILLNNEQSIEASRSNLTSISNMRDAYSAISSNNLNRTIEILTIVTVALTLPNLFFGMFGMNVPLPFEHRSWSFLMVLGLCFASILVLFVIGRRKRII